MKKIVFILVMLLTGLAANAQERKSEVQENFKSGFFYIFVDEDYNTLMFRAVKGTEVRDADDNIFSADFVTEADKDYEFDLYRKGNEWLKGVIEDNESTEDEKFYVLRKTFKDYGMFLHEYSITEDGRVKMNFILEK